MKITAGLGFTDDYPILARAGADEVFCGYVPHEWNAKYQNIMPLNRREVFFYHVQIGCLNEMKILKKMMDVWKVPVSITLNALYYLPEQLPEIEKIISDLIETGFDSFIIADLGLVFYLMEHNVPCKIHLSGEMGEWNRNTLQLLSAYFKKFSNSKTKVTRIIYHRKNSISDMRNCGRNLKIEQEAFFMNENCHFSGAFCNSLHCDELVHICHLPYEIKPIEAKRAGKKKADNQELEKETIWNEGVPGESGCGLCALWQLEKAGITHLKVVGRGNHTDTMAADIKAAKTALKFLKESADEVTYKKRVLEEIVEHKCNHNCYYFSSGTEKVTIEKKKRCGLKESNRRKQ